MMEVFSEVTRDTDIKGWHVDGLVIGIIFTEMAGKEADARLILKHIANKCLWKLESNLGKREVFPHSNKLAIAQRRTYLQDS